MGIFSKKFNQMKNKSSMTRYIHVPYLYPMGSLTFAIACSHCKNAGSNKCHDCKCEKQSGFELKEDKVCK